LPAERTHIEERGHLDVVGMRVDGDQQVAVAQTEALDGRG
jgi:hypothetical protein